MAVVDASRHIYLSAEWRKRAFHQAAFMIYVRKHLEVGQYYCSDDGSIQGVIINLWPVENGSEVLVQRHSNSKIVRIFVPSEMRPKKQ